MSSQLWAKLSVRVTKSARRLAYPGRVVLSVLLVSLPFGFVLCVVAGGASFYSSSASVGLAAAGVAISVVGLLTSIILGTMALRRNRDVDRDLESIVLAFACEAKDFRLAYRVERPPCFRKWPPWAPLQRAIAFWRYAQAEIKPAGTGEDAVTHVPVCDATSSSRLLRVIVPEGVRGGQTVCVCVRTEAGNGAEPFFISTPPEAKPGVAFHITLPPPTPRLEEGNGSPRRQSGSSAWQSMYETINVP